ncbi:MAG: Gfo/Idh/MocA family oxidoreductase [Alphaproteobacteria bacterium]|jgi:predicted dehydrogenase|nr:Gfo/Idh/MocA family oxidoreductase [Alphaproteobacteria bacterium]
MADRVKVLVVGVGNMGRSHALAYHRMDGFELAGLMSPSIHSRTDLPTEIEGYPKFADFDEAMAATRPDAVSINSYTDTHKEYALKAFDANCHVFIEKPLAVTVADAQEIVDAAKARNRKLMVGYILRVHPAWQRFIAESKKLGKPLVMRMNLNQQSKGEAWAVHKAIMTDHTPLTDCGVHYVDVMCQMTEAKPVRVHGIGAKLSADTKIQNYGHLHIEFDDGSVGWYEAGCGPMMSEVAYFVKDVVGPKGHVSIVPKTGSDAAASDSMDSHIQTNLLLIHSAELDDNDNFVNEDTWSSMADEPSHDDLCQREQEVFYTAITEGTDLTEHMDSALSSLRIVLAADESIKSGEVVHLS